MGKHKDLFMREAPIMIRFCEDYAIGKVKFGLSDIYRFSYDFTEEFDEEPEMLNDPECIDVMNKVLEAMTKHFQDVIKDKDWSSLASAVCDARSDFNYNKKYYWLWFPETLMSEKELMEWKKYLKKRGLQ
ncbi:hypothetical protein II898_04215 [bacterium]|nr:hypothetical protein [bacterium]